MFSFLFVCMLIIFGFEYAGLVNREKNLEFRQSFVKGISSNNVFNKEVHPVPTQKSDIKQDLPLTKIEKEYKLNKMFAMLQDAAEKNVYEVTDRDLPEVVEFFE